MAENTPARKVFTIVEEQIIVGDTETGACAVDDLTMWQAVSMLNSVNFRRGGESDKTRQRGVFNTEMIGGDARVVDDCLVGT